jgi:hypothetical protein
MLLTVFSATLISVMTMTLISNYHPVDTSSCHWEMYMSLPLKWLACMLETVPTVRFGKHGVNIHVARCVLPSTPDLLGCAAKRPLRL